MEFMCIISSHTPKTKDLILLSRQWVDFYILFSRCIPRTADVNFKYNLIL